MSGQELARAGALLASLGLTPGTTGNISVRAGDTIACSPTGTRLGMLAPDDVSRLNFDGAHVGGLRPTKEWPMHLACYRADPAVGAVVHLHSTYSTAWSVMADVDWTDALPPLTPYLTMKVGKVAVVPYERPGAKELADHVSRAFERGYRALLMANHGSLVAAQSLLEAIALAEELEESAKLALLLRGQPVRPLSASAVGELRSKTRRA